MTTADRMTSENDLVLATERKSFGFVDMRATWGTPAPSWWHVCWMAVSCCNGWHGESEPWTRPGTSPQ